MNMHITERQKQASRPTWKDTNHQQKVDLIVMAYKEGNNNYGLISRFLSDYLNCDIKRQSIASVYRVNREYGGALSNHVLERINKRGVISNVALAEHLWNTGMAASAMARRLGVNMREVYKFAEENRDRFPVRVPKINVAGLKTFQTVTEPIQKPTRAIEYPDRVTRITSLGYAITMPRISMIDGRAGQ